MTTGLEDVRTHVIILAQGDQKRLLGVTTPKQLLELNYLDPGLEFHPPDAVTYTTTILERTLRQVRKWTPTARITVVCGPAIVEYLKDRHASQISWRRSTAGWHAWKSAYTVAWNSDLQLLTLSDPGNSSLKGLAQVLALREAAQRHDAAGWPRSHERTVVLLGDVVYSSVCIQALLWGPVNGAEEGDGAPPWEFVGTTDLSPSAGELWGMSWHVTSWDFLKIALTVALVSHPPFESTYQPGQLRRWLWAVRAAVAGVSTDFYTAIDDYTMDVDLPEHIPLLGVASESAWADDRKSGLSW